MLTICAGEGRWDSNIFKALRKHPEKQGMSEAMRGYYDWFVDSNNWKMKYNQSALIPIPLSKYPDRQKMEALISKGKSCINKRIRDFLKQECFYVGCDERAKLNSMPDRQNEAQSCLDELEKFKIVTEVVMDDYKNRILGRL